jgi:hypothetical protein
VAKILLKLVTWPVEPIPKYKENLIKIKIKNDNVVLIRIINKNYNKKEESIKLFIITLISKE